MGLIWTVLGALAVFAGLRYRHRLNSLRSSAPPVVDDAAIQRIIEEGALPNAQDESRLDREAAAEAEDEFWSEYWDEPDEYES